MELLSHCQPALVHQLTVPCSGDGLASRELRGALDGTRTGWTVLEAENRNAEALDGTRVSCATTVLAGDEGDLFLEGHLSNEALGACERILPRGAAGGVC